jgi:amino-acid N-acetyltransferase
MHTTIVTRQAKKDDYDAIRNLLSGENLPITDLNPLLENFFVSEDAAGINGVMGMDRYDNLGLLRSAIVKKESRNHGIASVLITNLFDHAQASGIKTLYLITNTAERYFSNKGFEKIAKENVPATVLQSKEFNGLCPASSVIMKRGI